MLIARRARVKEPDSSRSEDRGRGGGSGSDRGDRNVRTQSGYEQWHYVRLDLIVDYPPKSDHIIDLLMFASSLQAIIVITHHHTAVRRLLKDTPVYTISDIARFIDNIRRDRGQFAPLSCPKQNSSRIESSPRRRDEINDIVWLTTDRNK